MRMDSSSPERNDSEVPTKMTGSRLIAVANVIVVASGVLSIIPTYSVSAKTMESALASGNINKIRALVSVMQDGFSAYGLLFLVCFSLLLINAVLLWSSAGKKGCQ